MLPSEPLTGWQCCFASAKPNSVAEEWSVVDNLSRGRVDIAFARGWNAKDFPSGLRTTPTVEKSCFQDSKRCKSSGKQSYPMVLVKKPRSEFTLPRQRELPVWITCSGSRETFIEAGALGTNVLTIFFPRN